MTAIRLGKCLSVVGLLAVFLMGTNAWATTCDTYIGDSLATIIADGNSCTVGNQTYSNFGAGGALSNSTVSLLAADDSPTPPDNFGLSFTFSLTAAVLNAATADSSVDGSLTFEVSTATPIITDASLGIPGTSICATCEVTVGETLDLDNSTTDTVSLQASDPAQSTDVLEVDFPPVQEVTAYKDATSIAFGGCGSVSCSANLSIINENFSETETEVPEPASLTLIGSGLIAFAAIRRRRRKVS